MSFLKSKTYPVVFSVLVAAVISTGCDSNSTRRNCAPCEQASSECEPPSPGNTASYPVCSEPEPETWEELTESQRRLPGTDKQRHPRVVKTLRDPVCTPNIPNAEEYSCTVYGTNSDGSYIRLPEECDSTFSVKGLVSGVPVDISQNPALNYPARLLIEGNYPDPNRKVRPIPNAAAENPVEQGVPSNARIWIYKSNITDAQFGQDGTIAKYGPIMEYDVTIPAGNIDFTWNGTGSATYQNTTVVYHAYGVPNFVVPEHLHNIDLAPAEVRKKLIARHHMWCRPGAIRAVCRRVGSTTVASEAPEGDPLPAQCPPAGPGAGSAALGEGARLLGETIPALLQGVTDVTNAVAQNSGGAKRSESMGTAAKAQGTSTTGGGGAAGASGSGDSGGNGAFGAGMGPLVGTSAGDSGAGGGANNFTGAAALPTAGSSESATSAEQLAAAATLDYESAGGGRAKGKAGGGDIMGSIAGLFGGGGQKGGGPAGGGVAGVQFGKGGATGPDSLHGMTDAELEALLERNRGSDLFEIANRRYFRWGKGVLGQEATEALRKQMQ